ncbi:acyl-CoA dehydrogenase family protein [Actinomadura sp. NEAU-AAG7]|uniref:acyl-CoA dehydrogenase family protein n=1 Tax=Actinomadura sp. NEAU-AAG7 TaxID=2839640 RepID=UPI001BE4200E|nr:acyl-CoA dehydrogenase family protein [Actinomadura sp. NEAU-AAG7]MBT2209282.1 acyl-CoA dehydrogenase family protein [Actinomadura sp. NEAU-AAG7]
MTLTDLPDTELSHRVAQALPALRAHAEWADENRRLHEDALDALAESGALRMRVPARHGGLETDYAALQQVIAEIAHADGSAAWNTAVWSMCSWLAGLFPDPVQAEVFGEAGVRVCGVLSPSGTGRPDGTDLVIDGRWSFVSGAPQSGWQIVLAMAPAPGGEQMWPVMALVPMAELEIVDDWYTAGLRGTASVTTVASGVRVPAERVLPMPAVLQERYATRLNLDSPVWRAPMMATGSACFMGVATGTARAAVAGFLRELPGRKITYTAYESRRDAALTHFQVAEATYLADEADFHAGRLADRLDRKGRANEPWDVTERVSARAALGRVFQLAERAVDTVATASGATSLYRTAPVQRMRRDVQALNQHALMHPHTNAELYGRVLCGLEPNTAYL